LGKINVAAARLEPFLAASTEELRVRLRQILGRAKRQGAQLVALPQSLGLSLLGSLGPLAPEITPTQLIESLGYRSLPECYRDVGSGLAEEYQGVGSELAREFQLHLVFGSTLVLSEGGRVFDVAYLFAADGRLIGTQRRTHLGSDEDGAEWCQGNELSVFETSVGRIGLVIGVDVRYPEVSRVLCLQGANMLVHLDCATALGRAAWMSHLWREVQANQVFGVQCSMSERRYDGGASLLAPLGMTSDGDGILVSASAAAGDELVVGELDYTRLQREIDSYPIYGSLNYAMYERWFPAIYERSRVLRREPAGNGDCEAVSD